MEKTIKKERWERKYEEYTSGKLQQEVESIKIELDSATDSKTYREKEVKLKKAEDKLSKIEKNKDKIQNILEFKMEILEKNSQIKDKLEKIEEVENSQNKMNDFEKQLAKFDQDREEAINKVRTIENQLKEPNLTPEERAKKEEEKQNYLISIRENDFKYGDLLKQKNELENTLTSTPKSNKEELLKEELKNEQLIAKCNFIGANLVKGNSMEDIKAKLTNFKFTSDKETKNKIKQYRDMSEPEKQNIVKTEKTNSEADIKEKQNPSNKENKSYIDANFEKEAEGQELIVPTRFNQFLQKHPKIDGFLQKHPKIKNIITRVTEVFNKNKNSNEVLEIEDVKPTMDKTVVPLEMTKDEKEKLEATIKEQMILELNQDKNADKENDMLLGIAEKGKTQYQEDRRKEFAEKYKENKIEAANRYAETYGGQYYKQDGATAKPEQTKEDEGMEPGDE